MLRLSGRLSTAAHPSKNSNTFVQRIGVKAGRPGRSRLPGDLVQDRGVLYLPVICQKERLAQDYREGAIAFERQEYLAREPAGRRSAGRHDAQVLVVRLHQYVAAAEVDLVRANIAPYDQEPLRQAATVRYLQPGDQTLQHLFARPGR